MYANHDSTVAKHQSFRQRLRAQTEFYQRIALLMAEKRILSEGAAFSVAAILGPRPHGWRLLLRLAVRILTGLVQRLSHHQQRDAVPSVIIIEPGQAPACSSRKGATPVTNSIVPSQRSLPIQRTTQALLVQHIDQMIFTSEVTKEAVYQLAQTEAYIDWRVTEAITRAELLRQVAARMRPLTPAEEMAYKQRQGIFLSQVNQLAEACGYHVVQLLNAGLGDATAQSGKYLSSR